METFVFFVGFVIVAFASYLIGKFFTRIGLPYITGYLFAGALVGPFLLNFLPEESVAQLRFVDQLSLAIIAFVAGSELFLKDLRSRVRSILFSSLGISVIGILLGGTAIFILTNFLSFTQGRPIAERFAVAMLGGVVLLALSPPSTIAVIKEVRAQGPFTRTALSVTVFMDVLIIVLFAITTSLASVLLTNEGFSGAFVIQLAVDLALAVAIGVVVGKLLQFVLSQRMSSLLKIGLILLIGYGVYFLSDQTKIFTPDLVGYAVYIEPLLICLIGGFMVTNFTPHRDEFEELLHDIGPAVYVAFFTLTGISLKLDILLATLPFAVLLFMVRMGAIWGGTRVGAIMAGESDTFRRLAWMALITQAGIALGLAREVSVQFPSLGTAFATLIISVIVLNEIFGPMLLKEALKRSGEANIPGDGRSREERAALILGIEPQSLALARELQVQNWTVVMVDTDASHVADLAVEDVDERHIEAVDDATLTQLITEDTDAVVALLEDDEANMRAINFARDRFGIERLVVRPTDGTTTDDFDYAGAFVVDPASAMIGLMARAVVAPQTASLVMHKGDPDSFEIVQRTVTNPQVNGFYVRDLRLPKDVLLLGVRRNGQSLLPSGYTQIYLKDELTLIGSAGSLHEATMQLGY